MIKYRPEIDGLRAVAVVPVILFHGGFHGFGGGFVGVDVFFVISGYLITSIILAEQRAGSFTLAGFYERRVRRILPALFLVILACVPLAWTLLLPGDLKAFCESALSVVFFVSNIYFWRTTGYFESAADLKPLLHTWSLAVEEQYYLLFPLFLIAAWRLGRARAAGVLVAIALASFALAQWGTLHRPAGTFYLLPTRVWELLLGALLAMRAFGRDASGTPAGAAGPLALLGLLMIAFAIHAYDATTPMPGVYALVPTLGAALVIRYATPHNMTGRVLAHRRIVSVGLLSYSAYLWHQPLFAFARHAAGREPEWWLMCALAATVLPLAYLTWRYVERPFRDRRRIARPTLVRFAATLGLAFVALGIAGHATTGFVDRYPEEDRLLASLQSSEAGQYVKRRFDALLAREFDAAGPRPRILIIGDSYGQDLVNALYESGEAHRMQISTRLISHHCGNLFVEQARLLGHVDRAQLWQCRGRWLYEDEALRQRMRSADEIWFVAAWEPWQAALVAQSVANAEAVADARVRVFGRKNLGAIDIRALLHTPSVDRVALLGTVDGAVLDVNDAIARSLQPGVFVDVQGLLCGGTRARCPLFTAAGALISFDGGHLTAPGAKFLGERLAERAALDRTETAGAGAHPAPPTGK
jgi:peptidoglycan/LPS O-acetylase OafA/YrhL